jgi:hypothetical protein
MRMGLALVMLWDGLVSLANAEAFYSDSGVMPRSLLVQIRESPWVWSLHSLHGSAGWQMALIAVQLAGTVCLLAGYRTQLSLLIAWGLMASLQARHPLVLHGGDTVMRVLGFWGLFLPLGARWSLDARRGMRSVFLESGRVVSAASLGLLLQVAMIYWFTAALKFGNEWTRDGTAVYFALNVDQFVKPAGLWLLQFPDLCRALTFGVWHLQILGPFLAFVPWRTAWIRLAVVAAFWSLHLGIALCLRLGPFPWVMITAWMVFLPACFWDFLEARLKVSRLLPSSGKAHRWMGRAVPQVFALLCLACVVLWNLRTTDFRRFEKIFPRQLSPVGYVLRIEQYWALFAPKPLTDDGWLILEADLKDGRKADLLRDGRAVTLDKPASISAEYPDHKWQKLMMNLWLASCERTRPAFAEWFVQRWNRAHPESVQVAAWTLVYMREETLPHYYAIRPQRVEIAHSKNAMRPSAP